VASGMELGEAVEAARAAEEHWRDHVSEKMDKAWVCGWHMGYMAE
jgi:hypothetical protein